MEKRYRISDGERMVWGHWVESAESTTEDNEWVLRDGVLDPHLC